jgi:hypothetical protein
MDVGGITRDEDTPHAQLSHVAMMNSEITAPTQSSRLESFRRAFRDNLAHEIRRWSIALFVLVLDSRHDAPSSGAHRENRQWTRFAGTELQFVPGQHLVRLKEMIIRGGENIFPREIEDFLLTHSKISDVHVVGLPDATLGETVAAWIRLKPGELSTEAEIQEFCQGSIAYFKIPQFIRFVTEFPMTVSGKVQKFVIREIEIRERGLEKIAQVQTA